MVAGGGMGCVLVFFFQAEDGIRDVAVTGVQTCALPIYSAGGRTPAAAALGRGDAGSRDRPAPQRPERRSSGSRADGAVHISAARRRGGNPRSEEHTSELQSRLHLVCRLLLEKKKAHNIA